MMEKKARDGLHSWRRSGASRANQGFWSRPAKAGRECQEFCASAADSGLMAGSAGLLQVIACPCSARESNLRNTSGAHVRGPAYLHMAGLKLGNSNEIYPLGLSSLGLNIEHGRTMLRIRNSARK